ncbi:hypothetical protein O3M35_001846 [Rhynocoris fuscipes]|uniref:DRBM domain-containing protein n=1 Tax=Rhynocoris fuscipes TaxID=488301 RepID=A0AAW1CNW6_9HEMI
MKGKGKYQALGRSPQQKSCSHAVSCCAALINYCQRTGCAYPVYGYMTNNITKEVTAVISFPDGRQFKGLPSKEKSTAAETAACLTLNSLTEGKQVLPGRQMMKFGTAGNNLIGGQQPVVPFHQQTLARLNTQMTSLPSPPHQWCQPNKRENWRFQDNFQDQQHRPSPSFSANNFVPLQAQVARVQSNQQQQHLNKDLLKPTAQQPSVPQQQELNNQVGNTADNTITSANNDSAKVNEDVGGPIKVIAPHLILGDNKCMSTSADNPAKTSGMVGGIITATQQRRPPFQPRTRSRLAARFSVPINNPAAAATSSSQQLQQNNLLK